MVIFINTMIFVVVMHNGDVDEIDCGFCSGGVDVVRGGGISDGLDWRPCS